MTLRHQLFFAVSLIFLALCAGLMALSIHSTREYLQNQLALTAQDAASALSHPLANALAQNDRTLAEIQVATLFDRGYFQKIVVLDAAGTPVLTRQLPARIEKVPLWFSSHIRLETAPGEAFISSGWQQLGKVVVVSQPTYAYEFLWRSAQEIVWWMGAMYGVAMLLAAALLRIILRPLNHIGAAARAIQEKRFPLITVLPGARELKSVVLAMNAMSKRISEIIDAGEQRVENFRKEAFVDPVTGMENRRGFDIRLGHLLEEEGSFHSAYIWMVELDGLKDANIEIGYRGGDMILYSLAEVIRTEMGAHCRISARIGGSAFAVVGLDISAEQAQALGKSLQGALSQCIFRCDAGDRIEFCVACVPFAHGDKRSEIFARLDLCAEAVRQAGRNQFNIFDAAEHHSELAGSSAWRAMIGDALKENRWALLVQPVVRLSDRTVSHHEIFARLMDEHGNLVPAATFLPMALRHQLMEEVDRAVITLIFNMLRVSAHGLGDVAVNISVQSVCSPAFGAWLFDLLGQHKQIARHLSFELSEFACAENLPVVTNFVRSVRAYGVRFGIDHFGLDPRAQSVIRQVPPDYIKLDGVLTREAAANASVREHLRSIASLAATLEIPLIAQSVETGELVDILEEDRVIGAQGHFFGAPETLK